MKRTILTGSIILMSMAMLAPPARAQATPSPKKPTASKSDNFTLGQRLLDKKQFAAAASAFAQFAKDQPNDPRAASAWLQEGVCNMRLDKPSEAVRCWNWILQRYTTSPQVPAALERLITYYEKRDQPSEVTRLSAQLQASYPQHPAALRLTIKQAEAAIKVQHFEDAVRLLVPLREQLTAEQRRQLEFAQLSIEARTNPAKLLAAADSALKANDPAAAVPLLESFLARTDAAAQTSEAKVKLGWAYYCLPGDEKNQQRAEALWEQIIRKGPTSDEWVGESQWHMIQLLAGPRGKWKEAVARCQQVGKDFAPGTFRHEQALFTAAWLLWTHKQWAASQIAFQEFIKAYPQKATHLRSLPSFAIARRA